MKTLLVASSNPGKITEIKTLFSDSSYSIISTAETNLPANFDPEETGSTFSENACLKAKAYASATGFICLSDDSGLIVDALDGRPGVYSKRYGATDLERNQKIITELQDVAPPHRTARFVSAICVYDPVTGTTTESEGVVEGIIASEARGNQGFGYDPIFIPNEIPGNKTFAELGSDIKNTISHRSRALQAIRERL